MALLFFAITLFVSAFLLFLVQPIIGKMILPKLGGTPQVWNTCMVFFQTALLAGYFYTHAVSTYFNTRKQIIIHGLLLFLPLLFLLPGGPFNILDWVPPPGGNPVFATLGVLTIVIGVPFFVVATSAPLLQKWFAHTGHPAAADPYFLYGASNLGSMLALLLYPVLIEPWFGLQSRTFDLSTQNWLWTAGYFVFLALVLGCGAMAFLVRGKLIPAHAHGTSGRREEEAASTGIMETPSSVVAPPVPAENLTPAATTSPPAAEEQPVGTEVAAGSAPAQAPAQAAASASAPPKPGPSTAIKTGSKQIKKGGKKHQQKQQKHQPQQKQQPKQDAIQKREHVPHTPAPAAPAATGPGAAPVTAPIQRGEVVTAGRRLRWIGLAAVPCSLMLGVTTHMSTDISAIPLFWVIPLSLYLLSFIFVFMRWPVTWIGQPHTTMLYLQPVLLCLLVVTFSLAGVHQVVWPITINLLAFFVTALVCHGELAKDRPSTKYLTEFYLCMSLGGMLGGMFNGLLAPILFPGLWEYNLAIIAAAFLRPRIEEGGGWADKLLGGLLAEPGQAPAPKKGHKHGPRRASSTDPSPGLIQALDVALPVALAALALLLSNVLPRGESRLLIAYGAPLAIACFYYARPIRFGLALTGIILVMVLQAGEGRATILTERSYFGILHIQQYLRGEYDYASRSLTHGTTQHGQNFIKPDEVLPEGQNPNSTKLDLSRLATTYYHRTGPAGMAMERFDWFVKLSTQKKMVDFLGPDAKPADQKTYNELYASDARLPASVWGSVATTGSLLAAWSSPAAAFPALVSAWSEPAYAVIGLGTGTMASYARPFQHCHFYEIDERVRNYSLPPPGRRMYFSYLTDAQKRGAQVEVMMGDARLRMAQPWIPEKMKDDTPWDIPMDARGGPEHFYYLMVVDAFSSDAIPVHLLTREAVQMYMSRLAKPQLTFEKNEQGEWVEKYWPGGVLCVHVSNRHLNLVPVVVDIANDIKGPVKVPVAKKDPNTKEYVIDPQTKQPVVEWVEQPLVARRGRDNSPGQNETYRVWAHIGHSTSDWVMVARDKRDLDYLAMPADYPELRDESNRARARKNIQADTTPYWSGTLTSLGRFVWTDDYSNLLAVFRPFSKVADF
ncbi:MAG: hypothetical protein L0Z62_43995 [Gemmataceae bacterium]|nr:hypothetical protein [Gemmataceae bacterium]